MTTSLIFGLHSIGSLEEGTVILDGSLLYLLESWLEYITEVVAEPLSTSAIVNQCSGTIRGKYPVSQ